MIMSNSTYNQLTANLELLKLSQMKLHPEFATCK